jgi:murein DD-endopeptidase MepM/ murein hydrolase activator NlpD
VLLSSVLTAVVAGACWLPPVDAPVVDPFRAPTCVWCPGNRGLDYGTGSGVPVRSVAAGTVSFSGVVAGIGYVVIRHADGRRATYGGVTDVTVRAGARVPARAVVGVTAADLHFGLRDGDRYVDPTPLLGRPATRIRLIPLDDLTIRPLPVTRATCVR